MKKFKWWEEDAPVNATGTSVAGTGDDDSTVVVKKKIKVYRRKKRMTKKEVEEARDYRKEYDDYHAKPEQRERNAARLRARRQMEKWGKVKKFDKKDVHHKDNNPLNNEEDNLAVTTQNWNRSEPRLRKEELDEAVSVKEFDSLKKGDTVTIEYKAAMSSGKSTFKVTAKNVVGKARVEKVTLQNIKNPRGVKHFLYKRSTGVTFAQGDMGSQVVSFKKEEVIAEAKYDIYHKTYSAAVQHAAAQAEKRGYEIDQDSWDSQITHGDRKPSTGKTVSKKIALTKGGKPQRKHLNIQVHGMSSGKYELNMYIEEVIDDAYNSHLDQQLPRILGRPGLPKKKEKKKKKKEEVEESINIDERKLTDTELKRREEIAKDLSDADFKNRYGDRWKEVKMGVATNMAKKESVNEQEEDDTGEDERKAKELKIAKAIAQAKLIIARNSEKVQKLTVTQQKMKDKGQTEGITMGKKYLETKQGTLEESVLGVWHNAAEELGNLNAVDEGFPSALVKKAVDIAKKMGGNMTGAVEKIEKLKKGLSKDKAVADALRLANEEVTPKRVDGRTKSYKETLRRIKIRHEKRAKSTEPVKEATGDKEAYQKFFKKALKKFGANSPADLKGDDKKKFYDYVDKNWTADHEEQLEAHKKKVKGDGEDEDKNPVGKSYNEDIIHELYSVEYKFKSDKDAKAAATFIAKHASPGKLEIDVQKNFVDVYVVGGVSGSGGKELKRAKAEVDKYFKGKIVDTKTANEETIHEAAITVTFDVQDGAKFKSALGDHGLRGKKVKGDGGVRGDSVEVKGDPKKLKKLAKDDERGSGNILRIHDNGQLKLVEAAIDDLRKIVDTKSMGKVSGTKVDLFSASAMVKVYDALNDKNKKKVEQMLNDKRGILTFQKFAFSQIK